jgi:hypothetical protein
MSRPDSRNSSIFCTATTCEASREYGAQARFRVRNLEDIGVWGLGFTARNLRGLQPSIPTLNPIPHLELLL